MKKFNFKNKIAVITGGGSGIGKAAALAFVKSGSKVFILGRNLKKLKTAQKEISEFGFCESFKCNVSNERQVRSILKNIQAKQKSINILVNCAGIYGPVGKFHTNSLKIWAKALEINLFGTVNVCFAVLPYMLKQKTGFIVNLSGGGAVQPFPNFSAYATSKAAVVRFTENLAKEYEAYNIQVNAIAPGAINTFFLKQVLKAGAKKVGKDFYEKSLKQKQSGGDSIEEAVELILWLCSVEANKLSGKLISAKWDKWKKFTKEEVKKVNRTSELTLRRIDNKYFLEKK